MHLTEQDLYESILWRKKEINLNGWNAYELSASQLKKESGLSIDVCRSAMKKCMLEGDQITADTEKEFSVCYYCDNLSEHRKRLFW